MALKPLKILGKLVSAIIPGGGIVKDIISPDKTPEQVKEGLKSLTPIAQYNRTMARPRIALSIVYVYLLGVVVQWVQQICKVAEPITIPSELLNFATIAIGAYIGSRGLEKMVASIFKKTKKKK